MDLLTILVFTIICLLIIKYITIKKETKKWFPPKPPSPTPPPECACSEYQAYNATTSKVVFGYMDCNDDYQTILIDPFTTVLFYSCEFKMGSSGIVVTKVNLNDE